MTICTALESPANGPDSGGLFTVTETGLALLGVPEPSVNPFCVAALCAAEITTLLPAAAPWVTSWAAAIAAASAAVCIRRLVVHRFPTSIARAAKAASTASAIAMRTRICPRGERHEMDRMFPPLYYADTPPRSFQHSTSLKVVFSIQTGRRNILLYC